MDQQRTGQMKCWLDHQLPNDIWDVPLIPFFSEADKKHHVYPLFWCVLDMEQQSETSQQDKNKMVRFLEQPCSQNYFHLWLSSKASAFTGFILSKWHLSGTQDYTGTDLARIEKCPHVCDQQTYFTCWKVAHRRQLHKYSFPPLCQCTAQQIQGLKCQPVNRHSFCCFVQLLHIESSGLTRQERNQQGAQAEGGV